METFARSGIETHFHIHVKEADLLELFICESSADVQ